METINYNVPHVIYAGYGHSSMLSANQFPKNNMETELIIHLHGIY